MDIAKIFRADVSELIGAYFDGEKIFLARLTDKLETLEVEANGAEFEQLAEKILQVCLQRDWKTSAVGFCLQDSDAVTFQTEVGNVPEKEIPAMVKSWAAAQAGADAAFAFTRVGEELWMETLPRTRLNELCAAFDKFGLKLCALSVMPSDLLTKISPFDRAKFIATVIREKKSSNLLTARGGVWNWKKISQAVAAIFFGAILFTSAKILLDYQVAANNLDAAKISLDELRDDLAVKENLDADIVELNRLNKICAAQKVSPKKFNFLLNLGRVAGGGVRLTSVRADENFLELEGLAVTPDAVKSYLGSVKNSVIQTARLETSSERDDGEIFFVIRAKVQS